MEEDESEVATPSKLEGSPLYVKISIQKKSFPIQEQVMSHPCFASWRRGL